MPASAFPTSDADAERILPRAIAVIRDGTDRGLHVGAQIYISLRNREVVHWATGLARPNVSIRTDTLVPWLSAGKPLTVAALARAWERGELQIDDPVVAHIPEFTEGGKSAITLRHVLTHTAGLAIADFDWIHQSWEDKITQICAASLPAEIIPGTRAAYDTQINWFLLGEVLRRIDSRSNPSPPPNAARHFAEIIHREVYQPCGMTETAIGVPLEQQEEHGARMALLYETTKEEPNIPRLWDWDTPQRIASVSPGGSARGPIRELGRFYENLLHCLAPSREDEVSTTGASWLHPQTVEAITAPHRVGMMDETFRHKVDWGLGVLVNSNHYGAQTVPYGYGLHASRRTFGHGGAQGVTAFADPEHGLVVTAFFNGRPGEGRHSKRVREFNTALYQDLGLS